MAARKKGGLRRALRRLLGWRQPEAEKQQQFSGLENPYRRMYTSGRTLEELARSAREEQKKKQ